MTKSRGINCRHPYDRIRERSPIDPETGCQVWSGAVNWGGYGVIYDYRIRRYVAIHRLAYETVKGPIPEGLQIDHLCRNTRCGYSDHLEAVTCKVNMERRAAAQTHCKHGHEFTSENTYLWRGRRNCRACVARRGAARYRAKTSAA